jgi:hypothetical protein
MSITKRTELEIKRSFDRARGRHKVNGVTHVLHCHHYLTLYTQIAEDCGMLDGRKLLAEVCEDTFREVLSSNWRRQGLDSVAERIEVAEQYYCFTGMGLMKVRAAGPDHAEVELEISHVDAGWQKKWGARQQPANHFTCGYIAGMLAALFDSPPRSWKVQERSSILAGAGKSRFAAVRV